MARRRQDTTSASTCVMPCTPPRTRLSRARTGWSGSANESGPAGARQQAFRGDRGRGGGRFPGQCGPALGRQARRSVGARIVGARASACSRATSAAGLAGRTAPAGPGGGLRRVRHRRCPGVAPAAPGFRPAQLGGGDHLLPQQRNPGRGRTGQPAIRVGRQCQFEQHLQRRGQRKGDRVFFIVLLE